MKKILITSLVALLPMSIHALEPQTSTQVSASEVIITKVVVVEEEINAYVGISECKSLLENEETVAGKFTTAFDTTFDDEVIDNYYHFDQTRNLTTKIDCDSGALCTTIASEDVMTSGNEYTVNVLFSDLTGIASADGCTGLDREFFIRMTTKNGTIISPNDVRFVVDTIRPPAPTGLEAVASEGTLNINFVPNETLTDVKEFTAYYSTEELVAGELAPSSATKVTIDEDQTSASIDVELQPGETIYVGIASNDETDNRSVLSNIVQTTVIETDDFWETYKKAGGAEEGCASTNGNQSWVFLLLGFFFLRGGSKKARRHVSRKVVTILTTILIILVSTNAFAESDIWGSFEFKVGALLPSIDDEFGANGPYASTFENESILVGELEFDAHLISSPIVLLGVGAHWGYGSVTGPAISGNGSTTADTTSLTIMPFRLSAVARLTYLATKFNVPFVPSLKIGVDAYRWSISDPSGDTSIVNGVTGSGWKPGWHAGAGLHFLLNFLAPEMASNFDFQWGVNRSYLFAEYMVTSINGFGEEGFDFSDNYWNFGLAFDF